jgi:hypothetical protein
MWGYTAVPSRLSTARVSHRFRGRHPRRDGSSTVLVNKVAMFFCTEVVSYVPHIFSSGSRTAGSVGGRGIRYGGCSVRSGRFCTGRAGGPVRALRPWVGKSVGWPDWQPSVASRLTTATAVPTHLGGPRRVAAAVRTDPFTHSSVDAGSITSLRRHSPVLMNATLRPSGDKAGCTQLTPSHALTFLGAPVPRRRYTSVHSMLRDRPRRLSVFV